MSAALRLTAASLAVLALAGCERTPDAQDHTRAASAPVPMHAPFAAAPIDASHRLALQALTDRVAALESQRQPAQAQTPAAAVATDARTARRPTDAEMRAGPPGSDASAQRDPQQLERERQAELDTLFRQEPVNTAWANATAAVVRQALPAPVDGQALALRGVECRSQTCRVEVGAGGADAMRQTLPQFAQRLAERFPSMAVVSRHDGTGATLYFRT